MAQYRQIHIKIWTSPDVQKLQPEGKLAFIYLFSTDHRNEAALYRITFKTIAHETDLTVDQVDKAMTEMEQIGLIKYDRDNHIVWVVNALKYQSLSPNGVTSIRKDLQSIDHPFVSDFYEYYGELLNSFQTPSKGNGNPLETPPVKGKGKGNVKGKDKDNGKLNDNDYPPTPQDGDLPPIDPDPALDFSGRRIIFTSYEQEFGRPLSPFEVDQLQSWFEDYPDDLILHALKEAVLGHNRTMKYIRAILENWKTDGVKCVQDAEERERKFQEKKASRASPGNGKTNTKPEEPREIYIPPTMRGG